MISGTPAEAVLDELRRRELFGLLVSVCRQRGVMLEDLCGRGRARSVALARHELWWRIRTLPDRHYSYPEIARMFARDPTTILHGVAAHQRFLRAEQP